MFFCQNEKYIRQNAKYIVQIECGHKYSTWGERMKLKLARVAKDLSQQELADRVGATRQTIGLIEKGKYNPSLNLCIRIARELDKTLDDLFWEDEHEEK